MKYVAKHHIRHDGRLYEPGEALTVPDDVAAYLARTGAAEPVREDFHTVEPTESDPPETDETGQISQAEQRIIAAAKEAIKAGQVTKDGRPTVEAVEAILGIQITAEQRDQAWEIVSAEKVEG
jgi:hypothetical protein